MSPITSQTERIWYVHILIDMPALTKSNKITYPKVAVLFVKEQNSLVRDGMTIQ